MQKIIKIIIITFFLMSINPLAFAKSTDNGIKIFHLDNGQTVIIKEVHSNPIVTIDTWIKTGSINENDVNNGVSHFLEHLLFKGTSNHKAGEAEKILESKGAVFNAATSKDFTHYYVTIPSKYAETALDLHSDMLLNAVIPQDQLDKERKPVHDEIRMSKDSPDRILFDNLNAILFKSHPYKYDTLGSIENIEKMPREEILNYYHKWYVPNNMTTVIVGDVDTDKILEQIKKDFKCNKNTGKSLQMAYAPEPYLNKEQENIEKGNYNGGYMTMGFKGVPVADKKDSYALDLASLILGGGKSSRLYQNVKEKYDLVSSISSGHYSMKDDSIFYIDADFPPENYSLAKNAIIKEIDRLQNGKITPEELQRAKIQIQRDFLYSNESVENIANSIGYNLTIGNNLDSYINFVDEVNKINVSDVQKAMRKYVSSSKMALSAILPEKTNINSIYKANENYSEKNITKTELNNGMTLITERNNSNKIISLSVFIKGGNLVEPVAGMNELIATTLMKGTAGKSAVEISNELENSGIIIAPSSNPDYFEIQLKSTAADFDKAFEILADVLKNPAFKDEYINKAKNDIIQGIQQSRDEPLSYAFEKFNRAMYPDHPYGYTGEIIEKILPSITRDDLIKFYKEIFIPENMIVSISGNIDTKELAEKFYQYFPSAEGKKIDLKALNTPFKPLSRNEFTSVKKDVSAASLIMGWPSPGISESKDYASLKIINSILGGGLSSRLFVDLRAKQGLAYEVNNIYSSRLDNSAFVLYISTEPKNVELAKNGFIQEINRIKTEPVSEKELDEAKQKIIGQLVLAEETNQEKAHYLGWFETLGKGYRFNYEYQDLINSITADDIINTANKYLNSPYIISIVAPEKSVEILNKEYADESKR